MAPPSQTRYRFPPFQLNARVPVNLQEAFKLAVDHHRAGRLREAGAVCGKILEAVPEHAGALHLSGVMAAQAREFDRAAALLTRAAAVEPNDPLILSSLGNVLVARGKLDEAVAAYQKSLAAAPESASTLSNYGNALKAQGRLEEAVGAYRRALAADPNNAPTFNNLGNALFAQGRREEAEAAYGRALSLDPAQEGARKMLEQMAAERH